MTLNFGVLLLALSVEQVKMSTAMPNALRVLNADMVKVVCMLISVLMNQMFRMISKRVVGSIGFLT